ncbi:sodium- and chloride-dependent GABA transporter ine-like [Tropilaelaps mercedesae]|uniref:Sodium-and chloride-dependent GABA transporter ine-like n=1 Tax=Tropilaelaps mercedesae TaxID=418985 RepID=A0A1V9X1U0_9ACAR|nr:sodium- and chloride-dependent GABA transporter ine-like [Tropilaelaps mercedesae]
MVVSRPSVFRTWKMETQGSDRFRSSGMPVNSSPLSNPYAPYEHRQVSIHAAPYVLVQTPAGLVPSMAVNPSGGTPELPLADLSTSLPPLQSSISMTSGTVSPPTLAYPITPTVTTPTPTTITKKGMEEAARYLARSFSLAEHEGESISTAGRPKRRRSRSVPELRHKVMSKVVELDYYSSSDEDEYVIDVSKRKAKSHETCRHYLDLAAGSAREALGLANIWRFPYFCFIKGGGMYTINLQFKGPFLMAYMILLVVVGVPMICIEMAAGRATHSGPIQAIGKLAPLVKGVGFAGIIISYFLSTIYAIVFAWSLFYFFNSFHARPRWARCTNPWNTANCTQDPEQWYKIRLAAMSSASSINGSDSGRETSGASGNDDTLNKSLSLQLAERTSTAQEFFDIKVIELSDNPNTPGVIRWELFASITICLLLAYISLRKKSFFSEKIKYVLSIIPFFVFAAFLIRVLLLEGARDGIQYFFTPNLAEMKSAKLWVFALAQTIHSLGLTLGPNYVVSSRNKKQISLMRDTTLTVLINVLVVFVVGSVTFGAVGHLCVIWRQELSSSFFHKDPGLVFVMYTEVIKLMPLPPLWAVLFWFLFICLAMDSINTITSTVVHALEESYGTLIKQRFQGRAFFLLFICFGCLIMAIPYVTDHQASHHHNVYNIHVLQAGLYYLMTVDYYISTLCIIVVCFAELCALAWLYGGQNLLYNTDEVLHPIPYVYLRMCWATVSPLAFMAVTVCGGMALQRPLMRDGRTFPLGAVVVGWGLFGLVLLIVPVLAIRAIARADASGLIGKIKTALQPQVVEVNDDLVYHGWPYWDPKPRHVFKNGTSVYNGARI